jgi:uncharacterized phiE125 gp8 family phage protein
MITSIKHIIPPSGSPVSADDFKWHARIDCDDDTRLNQVLERATNLCQHYSGRAIMYQRIEYTVVRWPGVYAIMGGLEAEYSKRSSWLTLPYGPVQQIISLTSYDAENVAETLAYYVDDKSDPWRIIPETIPSNSISVVVIFDAQLLESDSIPYDRMSQAILLLAARMYEHRGDESNEDAVKLSGAADILDTMRSAW